MLKGFTQLSNALINKIIKDNSFPIRTRIYFVIVQKTIGWNKEFELIKLEMFQENLQYKKEKLVNKSNIRRTLTDLVSANLITEKNSVYSIVGGGVKGQNAELFPETESISGGNEHYQRVIDGFNKITGKRIKLNKTSKEHIKKAFENEYSVEDILKAFKNRLVDEWWVGKKRHKDFPSMFSTKTAKGDPVDYIGKFLEDTAQSDFEDLQESFKKKFAKCQKDHNMTKEEVTECLSNRGEPPPQERDQNVDLSKIEKSTRELYKLYKKMEEAKKQLTT